MPILTSDRRTTAKNDQPKDKKSAQTLGVKEQKEAAKQQFESPGQPASGE
jgi:hypothetical protein